MNRSKTIRGFDIINFIDSKGVECSIQKSSQADDDYIWLGANKIGLKRFIAGRGWEDIELTQNSYENYIANNRIHINREQAREIVEALQVFIETGDL